MPCGLVAKSFFNDTYVLKLNTEKINIDENGIAWDSDKEYKFKVLEGNNKTTGKPLKDLYWMNVTDGKIKYQINIFRTFHCLDENCWSS